MTETIKVLIDHIDPITGVLGNITKTNHTDHALRAIFPQSNYDIEYHASGSILYKPAGKRLKNWIYPVVIHNLTFMNFLFDWGDTDYDILGIMPPEVKHHYDQGRGTVIVIILEPIGSYRSTEKEILIRMVEGNPRYKNILFLTLHYIDSPNFLFVNILEDTMKDWGPAEDLSHSDYNKLEDFNNRRFCCFLMNYKESKERTALIEYLIKTEIIKEGFVSARKYSSEYTFKNLDIEHTFNKVSLNIIPEGNWDRTAEPFMSEKVYRSFLFKKPFIYIGQYKSLKYIKSIGYKTFSPVINEEYDNIMDNKIRFITVCNEIKRLMTKPKDEFNSDMNKLIEICKYNYNLYIQHQKENKQQLLNIIHREIDDW